LLSKNSSRCKNMAPDVILIPVYQVKIFISVDILSILNSFPLGVSLHFISYFTFNKKLV